MSVPRVTVLLSVCNGEPYLAAAIRSILAQTYDDFALLVIDDASTDAGVETLASFRNPRLRVVRNESNLGLAASLNRGLSLIESEYVARMDADDLAMPERLATQVAFLDAHRDVAVAGSQGVAVDARGRRLRRVEWWHREWYRPRGGEALDWYRMFDTPLIHSSVMFRRAVVRDELGGYDATLRFTEDADLWMRVARRHRLANLDAKLVAMRLLPSSMTGDPNRPERRAAHERKVAMLHQIMCNVRGRDDVPRRIAETWAAVAEPSCSATPAEVRQLCADIDSLAAGFGGERTIVRHRASLFARMAEKIAPQDRGLALALYGRVAQLDPAGACFLLPRFALLGVFGDAPFRWRRARLLRKGAA